MYVSSQANDGTLRGWSNSEECSSVYPARECSNTQCVYLGPPWRLAGSLGFLFILLIRTSSFGWCGMVSWTNRTCLFLNPWLNQPFDLVYGWSVCLYLIIIPCTHVQQELSVGLLGCLKCTVHVITLCLPFCFQSSTAVTSTYRGLW